MSVRGVRDALKSIIPNWLADRAGQLNKGFKVLWTAALMADGEVETSLEGFRAAMPGLGTPTAFPYHAASRGILRGLTESDDAYAARLRKWLDTWRDAASDETLLTLIQAFLGPDAGGVPKCRIITRAGHFTTINPDGSFTYATDTSWNWDQTNNPERIPWWGDLWIVVYVNSARWPVYSSLTDSNWTSAWGTYNGFGLGHQVPRVAVDGVNAIIAAQKGAHTFIEAVIICTDTALFVPGSLGTSGNPNGHWAYFSGKTSGGFTQAPARTTSTGGGTVRYWCPPDGG